MYISVKLERLMSKENEQKEHQLVGNSPSLLVTIITTVATIIFISAVTVVAKRLSWKLG